MNGQGFVKNGCFRHKAGFAAVSNSALKDTRLSLRAKGLYALIQSYISIPDYDLYKRFLQKSSIEGTRAFDGAWNELKKYGYLKQYRIPGKDRGRFEYEYDLLDVPDETTPSIINLNYKREAVPQDDDVPEAAPEANSDHTIQNVPYGQADGSEDKKPADHTLQKAPYAQSTICSEHHMLGAPYAKRGSINNTGSNKTEINKNKGSKNLSVSQSTDNTVSETDRQTDEIRSKLKEQIDYDFFEDNYPDDLPGVNALLDCMAEMLVSPATKINGVNQTRYALKHYIDQVTSDEIRSFLDDMRGKSMQNVKNVTAYWRSSFINYLRDEKFRFQAIMSNL